MFHCTCAPFSMPDDGGMCAFCERAIEEADAEARNEAFAREPDENDFPARGEQ